MSLCFIKIAFKSERVLTIIIAILDAPKNIRMVPAGTIEISAGDDVQFDCLAEGSPVPFVLIRKQHGQANRK